MEFIKSKKCALKECKAGLFMYNEKLGCKTVSGEIVSPVTGEYLGKINPSDIVFPIILNEKNVISNLKNQYTDADETTNMFINQLFIKYNVNTIEELYVAVSREIISMDDEYIKTNKNKAFINITIYNIVTHEYDKLQR